MAATEREVKVDMLSLLPTDLCLWQAHSMHSIILDLCLLLISAHEWPSLRQPVAAQFLLANSLQSPHRNWGFATVAGNRARKYMCTHTHTYNYCCVGCRGTDCVINSIQRAAHNCARLLLASRHRYRLRQWCVRSQLSAGAPAVSLCCWEGRALSNQFLRFILHSGTNGAWIIKKQGIHAPTCSGQT